MLQDRLLEDGAVECFFAKCFACNAKGEKVIEKKGFAQDDFPFFLAPTSFDILLGCLE